MIIAVPLTDSDIFSPHFGSSAKAGLFEVDQARRTILRITSVRPPEPEPCGWADWLGFRGVTVILVGGMGRGAQQRMAAAGIEVVTGVAAVDPFSLVKAWLERTLAQGANACEGDHNGHGHGHHHHEEHERGCSCGTD